MARNKEKFEKQHNENKIDLKSIPISNSNQDSKASNITLEESKIDIASTEISKTDSNTLNTTVTNQFDVPAIVEKSKVDQINKEEEDKAIVEEIKESLKEEIKEN
jgi:hypothetical protein